METTAIMLWVTFAFVVVLIAAVVALFIIKPNKNSSVNKGPQGSQGDIGRQGPGQGAIGPQGSSGPLGPAGDRGFQGPSNTGVFVAVDVITQTFTRGQSMTFKGNAATANFRGIQTTIGKLVTFEFSNIEIVIIGISSSDFLFSMNLPSGMVLDPSVPVSVFSGTCGANRQSKVDAAALYLSGVTLQGSTSLLFHYVLQSYNGGIWPGGGGTDFSPLLICNFSITVQLA